MNPFSKTVQHPTKSSVWVQTNLTRRGPRNYALVMDDFGFLVPADPRKLGF